MYYFFHIIPLKFGFLTNKSQKTPFLDYFS
jgi:hypothetical protein